jgi:hypothetical protein
MNLKKAAVRLALLAAYLPVAVVTPAAYFFLPFFALTGLGANKKITWSLGILVSLVSLLALYSLWRVWSIGRRIWVHAAYVPPVPGGRAKDGIGLLAGWVALAGLVVLSRFDKPWEFGLMLFYSLFVLPAAVLATVAFFFCAQRQAANKPMQATCEDARA